MEACQGCLGEGNGTMIDDFDRNFDQNNLPSTPTEEPDFFLFLWDFGAELKIGTYFCES